MVDKYKNIWGELISPEKKLGRPLGEKAKERALAVERVNSERIRMLLRQAMFNLIGNVRKGNKIYKASLYSEPVMMLDEDRPFNKNPKQFSASYIEMRKYLKNTLGWTQEEIEQAKDFSRAGGSKAQTYWLYQQGYLDVADSKWVDVFPDKDKPMQKMFPAGAPDGERTVLELQFIADFIKLSNSGEYEISGPKIPVTYKKVTIKEENGTYANGRKKYKKVTKFYRLENTYEINEEQRPQIEELHRRIESGQPEDSIENTLKVYDKDSALASDPALKKEVERLKREEEERKDVPLPEQANKPTTVYTPEEIQKRLQEKSEQRRKAQADRLLKKEPVQPTAKPIERGPARPALPPPAAEAAPKIPPLRSAQPAQPIIEGGQRSGQRPVPPVPDTARPTTPTGGGSVGLGPTRKRPKFQEGGFVTF